MFLSELIAHTRGAMLRDKAEPVLWSNEELIRYFIEAEDKFARHTHCLVSEDIPQSTLSVEEGKSSYTLDSSIIHVYEVYKDNGLPLRSLSRSQSPHKLAEGEPRAYSTGRGSKTIHLYPIPDKDYELTMLVAHTPTEKFKQESEAPLDAQEQSIPEENAMDLCLYVTYKALLNNGPEESNTTAAADFYTQWRTALREAKRDGFKLRNPQGATVQTNWTGVRRR